jgi:hypothetical protein
LETFIFAAPKGGDMPPSRSRTASSADEVITIDHEDKDTDLAITSVSSSSTNTLNKVKKVKKRKRPSLTVGK